MTSASYSSAPHTPTVDPVDVPCRWTLSTLNIYCQWTVLSLTPSLPLTVLCTRARDSKWPNTQTPVQWINETRNERNRHSYCNGIRGTFREQKFTFNTCIFTKKLYRFETLTRGLHQRKSVYTDKSKCKFNWFYFLSPGVGVTSVTFISCQCTPILDGSTSRLYFVKVVTSLRTTCYDEHSRNT